MSDSHMTFFPECPHCGRFDMTFYLVAERRRDSANNISFWQCAHCGSGVCGESGFSAEGRTTFDCQLFSRVYPQPKKTKAPANTPEDVAADYIEAKTSLRHGNIKAACMMARSAVETALIAHGAITGGLKDKINSLEKAHVITQSLAEWAYEIKNIGNDAAHQAEKSAVLDRADAEDAVNFAEMLFTYLYTLPGMIAERRDTSK